MVAADIDGDGQKEIICSFSNEIVVLTQKGEVKWKKSFQSSPRIAALDLTNDFVPEVIVILDGNLRFQVLYGKGQELARHDFYSRWYSAPREQLSITPIWSGNIDDDKSIEIVCLVNASYDLEPRGLYVFEYPSFKEE